MSKTSLVKKLRIKSGDRVAVLHAPEGYLSMLVDMPEDVSVLETLDGRFDIVHAFYTKMETLDSDVGVLIPAMKEGGILWISYPKGTAKKETDLNRDIIWKYITPKGLKAVSMIAIDEVWSAMRLKVIELV